MHSLVEFGPGRGTLMRDMLRATAKIPGFQTDIHCQLLEWSETLRAEQQATLGSCVIRPSWQRNTLDIEAPAIIIANEFFDALPVHQWVKSERGWTWRSVEVDGDGELQFGVHKSARVREDLNELFPDAPLGAILESQRPELTLDDIGARAKLGPVAMLIIDYGHEETGLGDTLQAVRNHAHEHPLTSPGEADLSAQVDFAEVANTARKAGLAVDGPITQAEFLGRLGIVERTHKLMAANPSRAAEIESGVARLMAPDSMGTRFKVLGLRSPNLPTLPGFEAPTSGAQRQ
jgi:SAM-dependent MidA family methyltransferase